MSVEESPGFSRGRGFNCGTADTEVTCTKSYSSTSDTGYYYVRWFYPLDDSQVEGKISSDLNFQANAAVVSSGGSGSSGSTTVIIQNDSTITSSLLDEINLTTGASESQSTAIADCLTKSLFMKNACSRLNYGVVVEPFNWWVAFGAMVGTAGLLMAKNVLKETKNSIVVDSLTYGIATIIIVALLTGVGFNTFILNYLIESSKYGFTFLSFTLWGLVGAAIGEAYKGEKRYKLRVKNPFEDLKLQ